MKKPTITNSQSELELRTIDAIPLEELLKRAARVKVLVLEIRALLSGLVKKSEKERSNSEGHLREGESATLLSILELVDKAPQYFTVLAEKDHGSDPTRFETGVLRERLERREVLSELSTLLSPMATDLNDHVLHLGELTRPPILAAYHIAKPLAEHQPQLGSLLSEAQTFYGRPARRAAATRRKKAAPRAATNG